MKTLTYAARFLMRARHYTWINLLGLALSLACCIVLMRYLHRETTVDSHAIRPYEVVTPLRDIAGNVFPCSSNYMDSAYVQPGEIVELCEFISLPQSNVTIDKTHHEADILVTDSLFFHFFRFELLAGEARLDAPEDVVLTEAFARRLFGDANPVGRSIGFRKGKNFVVRGVLKEPACKTTLRFDLLCNATMEKRWGRLPGAFIRLQPGVSPERLNEAAYVYRQGSNGLERYHFLPLKELYWENTIRPDGTLTRHGNRSHLYILAGVCLLMLLTGVINFVNLYMVQMMKRSREYGIKKIFGVQGRRLFMQLWTENVLLVSGALLVAWFLIEVTAVPVARLLSGEVAHPAFDLLLTVAIWLLLPLLTSLYPYVRYNYLSPMVSIRRVGTTKGGVAFRMGFLFVQCAITFLLIILSLYFGRHLTFLLHTDPGFRTDNILVANIMQENDYYELSPEEKKQADARRQEVKQALDACPLITHWMPVRNDILGHTSTSVLLNERGDKVNMRSYWVAPDFFEVYGLKVLQGALPAAPTQRLNYTHMVLNESAMKAFGYTFCEEAFVRSETPLWITVSSNGEVVRGGMELMPVAAVVKDFYPGHLTRGGAPMYFMVGNDGGSQVQMVCRPGKEQQLLQWLKALEMRLYHTEEFDYHWVNDSVEALYSEDRRLTGVYITFAAIAIVVSCLGLFGLSLYDIRQRYREIGIRKVNGARLRDIYRLLYRKYLLVLLAAFAVSAPLAWLCIRHYTATFVLKAPLGIGIFLIAFLLVLFIAMGTLFWQVRKAAGINPAEVVKE
ncbi:MAG: ABC transporter permease [Bacteroides sp.]|nr:ABC transporter permease [Bacteroides sp.]